MWSTKRRKIAPLFDANGDSLATTNKFPWKLWRIVNECRTGAIGWGEDGKTIVLHKIQFQKEYLDPPNKSFKTNNIGSFIRQLNLYGFKKVQPPSKQYMYDLGIDQDVQEFQNDCFMKEKPQLVPELRRHVGVRRAREQAAKRRYALSESLDSIKAKVPRTDVIRLQHPDRGDFDSCYWPGSGGSERKDKNPSRPCMLAVPIYSDGLPYIHPQVPPVLVEWDGKLKEWVATGPAYDVPGISLFDNKHEPGPSGDGLRHHEDDRDGNRSVLSSMTEGEFTRLVQAVSEALRSVPDCQLQSYLRDCETYHSNKWSSRSGTPSSLESYNSVTAELDECPYSAPRPDPPPKRVYKPGESLLRIIAPSAAASRGPFVSSPTTGDIAPVTSPARGHYAPLMSPADRHSAPMLSPITSHNAPIMATGLMRSTSAPLPSPITTKDVDFSAHHREILSPMSVTCEDEGPTMDLSPPSQYHHTLSLLPDETLKMALVDEEKQYDIERLCEL